MTDLACMASFALVLSTVCQLCVGLMFHLHDLTSVNDFNFMPVNRVFFF